MSARPVAGDFLRPAADQLIRAQGLHDKPTALVEITAIAAAARQVMAALSRYVTDAGPGTNLDAADAAYMDGWPRAVLDARLALNRGIRKLERGFLPDHLQAPSGNALADALLEVAGSLTAGRDLLQTHFAADSRGGRAPVSEWAPIITSDQVTRAVAAEVAACARQLAPIISRIAQSGTARWGETTRTRFRLGEACRELWAADRAVQFAHRREPAAAADLEMLRAVPLNLLPARALPGPVETVPTLCAGVTDTAERVRQATWQPEQAWSPAISAASLRHTAASGVVISHHCEVALEGLAARAHRFGLRVPSALLGDAADAARDARAGWLEAARSWGSQVVTDTEGRLSRVCVEAEDLAVWTGRLVYADPRWKPTHGRSSDLRPPSQLASQPEDLQRVLAAIHSAGQTLGRLAEAELVQLKTVAAAGRLYVPTRTLPEKVDIPRRYGPAPLERVEALTDVYRATSLGSSRLAIAVGAAVRPPPELGQAPAARTAGRASAVRPDPPTPDAMQGPIVSLLRQNGIFSPDLLLRALELEEDAGIPSPGLARNRRRIPGERTAAWPGQWRREPAEQETGTHVEHGRAGDGMDAQR